MQIIFPLPFDQYKVTVPVSELRDMRYKHFMRNKLYWDMWGQYLDFDTKTDKNLTQRSLFRSILGFNVWNEKQRDELQVEHLSKYLTTCEKAKGYYFMTVEVKIDTVLPGFNWAEEVKPMLATLPPSGVVYGKVQFKQGDKLLCRVNEMDWPYHIDMQWINEGDYNRVATVSWRSYKGKSYLFREIRCDTKALLGLSDRVKQEAVESPKDPVL